MAAAADAEDEVIKMKEKIKNKISKGIVILTIAALLSLVGVMAEPVYSGCGMMGYGYNGSAYPGIFGFGTGMMLFVFVIWTLVIVSLILFVIWMTKQINKKENREIRNNKLRK
jgi:uncharacterized membrane protein